MIALGPSQPDHPFHGLWSLWEMLEFNASAFYQAASTIRHAQGFLLAQKDIEGSEYHEQNLPSDEVLQSMVERLTDLTGSLEILETKVTKILSDRMLRLAREKKEVLNWKTIFEMMTDLDNRLRDELTLHKIFVLEESKARYFSSDAPQFGAEVSSKFVSAAFEIDEAAKCLALSRSTASVFHLMRLMEIGIRAVARCLDVPDPTKPAERNWGYILKSIKDELDARGGSSPKRTWSAAHDKEFFHSAYVSLDAVRVAWRNPTMHIENKYTDDEGAHIFLAVKGFMTKLASRCDENGEPKA
jgi:hypothetical protein